MQQQVVVVGAGMGGLVAACLLARAGARVVVVEAASEVGGKAWRSAVGAKAIDVGPSVLTLRHVFDQVFAACGERLDDHVALERLPQLARHVWAPAGAGGGSAPRVLDLYADLAQSCDAIGACFGAAAAREYAAFAAYAERLFASASATFVYGPKPTFVGALRHFGRRALLAPWEMDARRSMWQSLQAAFPTTPALVQLFGRYATYCGGSPFLAPATLNLVSHVERLGVHGVAGGISALARALAALARRQGAQILCGTAAARLMLSSSGQVSGVQLADGRHLAAPVVVLAGALRPNDDDRTLWPKAGDGAAGAAQAAEADRPPLPPTTKRWLPAFARRRKGSPLQPGLSADVAGLTVQIAPGSLVPACHNVFFFGDSRDEFAALFGRRQRPAAPTVYLCAPDRAKAAGPLAGAPPNGGEERLFVLTNAPPARAARPPEEQEEWIARTCARLGQSGLRLRPTAAPSLQGPADFARRFPGTDGVLYGPPPHSWRSFFTRPGSRTRWPGCYAAGGLTHPGPGVPMAALSGRQAAEAILQDFPSLVRSRPAATPGGTSTARATTAATS